MNKILRVLQCSLLILGCTLAVPGRAFAESVTLMPVIIIELQTASAASGKDEFIELYNPNAQAVDIKNWQVQYRAAGKTGETPKDWQQLNTTITCPVNDTECTTVIGARGRLTLASASLEFAHQPLLKDGMATESGQLRLTGADNTLQDMLGYGSAATAEGGKAAPKLQAGKSLKRRVNEDGVFTDSNNNAADFIGGCTPTPKVYDATAVASCAAATTNPEDTTNEPSDSDSDNNSTDPATTEETTQPVAELTTALIITEILPDPAAPRQDEEDEFIELYNPSDDELDLEGYKLQSGNDYRYSYTLAARGIAPRGYLVVTAGLSHLTLSNSGSKVRLINSAGGVDDEISYGAAKEGQSWMRDNTVWSWSLTPTPGTANVLTLPVSKPAMTAAAKAVTAKKTVAAAPKAKAVAAPKAAKPKSSQAVSAKTPVQPVEAAVPRGMHIWILVPVALAVAGYAIYEYRQNIARIWLRLRRPGTTSITKTEPADNE